MWYAYGDKLFSCVISALPVTLLISEGFKLKNAYQPFHQHYYLIPVMQIIYIFMIAVLLLLNSKNKKQFFVTLLISLLLSFISIKLDLLKLIFGGMNTVL